MIWALVGGLVRVVIAQMRVGREVARNRETICSLLRRTAPGDWVVFPEGALTGYFPGEPDYLADTGRAEVEVALERLRAVVARRGCHCLLGTARFVADGWRNSAVLLSPGSEVRCYDKNVLNPLDSRRFVAGHGLPVWEVDGVKVGVQICWELLFPQRWAQLKRNGAQVVFHLNNAVEPDDAFWEHILLARAFENRYFVASANNAAAPQTLPSYLIAPSGETLLTGEPRIEQSLSCELDPFSGRAGLLVNGQPEATG
jgi:predicted amidohydrolase